MTQIYIQIRLSMVWNGIIRVPNGIQTTKLPTTDNNIPPHHEVRAEQDRACMGGFDCTRRYYDREVTQILSPFVGRIES